ncbi:hypothetical protein Bca101_058832 [Brassica carinata]
MVNLRIERGTNVCFSVFDNLANKLDEKLVLMGDEHKVIVAININPKLVGGRLFPNATSLHIFILTKRMLVLPQPQPSIAVSRNWNLLQLRSLMLVHFVLRDLTRKSLRLTVQRWRAKKQMMHTIDTRRDSFTPFSFRLLPDVTGVSFGLLLIVLLINGDLLYRDRFLKHLEKNIG